MAERAGGVGPRRRSARGADRAGADDMRRRMRPLVRRPDWPALITGGAGFIGTNLAARLLDEGRHVRIFDNLSRAGVEANVRWLCDTYGDRVTVMSGDV